MLAHKDTQCILVSDAECKLLSVYKKTPQATFKKKGEEEEVISLFSPLVAEGEDSIQQKRFQSTGRQ